MNIAELQAALDFWECLEYVAVLGVVVGVAGESAHFIRWIEAKPWSRKLERASALLLILSLAFELLTLVRANNLSGHVIAFLDLERAKLSSQLAWREINKDQAAVITKMLAGRKVQGSFVVLNWQDPEQAQYFMSIAGLCNKLEIRCTLYPAKGPYPAPFPPPGVLSYLAEGDDDPFIDALKAANVVTGRIGTGVGQLLFADTIRSGIVIGPKPSPLGSEAWRTNAPPP